MPAVPSPIAKRLMDLPVGRSCVISRPPTAFIKTARRHRPGATYRVSSVDGQYVVMRTA